MTSWFLKRDAKNRSWRTFLQGLLATLLVPAADLALQAVQREVLGMFAGEPFDWKRTAVVAAMAFTTGLFMTAEAYLHRAKVDLSPIPSALPPRTPGATEEQAPATTPVSPLGR